MKTETHSPYDRFENGLISPSSPVKFEEEQEVSSERKELGLCENCLHLENCMYCKRANGPVMQCELHEEKTMQHFELQKEKSPALQKQYKGLCSNCENRESCCLPAKKHGALHCEEYC